eukprot:CFRG0129T1
MICTNRSSTAAHYKDFHDSWTTLPFHLVATSRHDSDCDTSFEDFTRRDNVTIARKRNPPCVNDSALVQNTQPLRRSLSRLRLQKKNKPRGSSMPPLSVQSNSIDTGKSQLLLTATVIE